MTRPRVSRLGVDHVTLDWDQTTTEHVEEYQVKYWQTVAEINSDVTVMVTTNKLNITGLSPSAAYCFTVSKQ